MLRISPFGQFVAGVSVALIIYDVCCTPTAREWLIAFAVVGRPKFPVADRGPRSHGDFLFLRLSQSLIGYPAWAQQPSPRRHCFWRPATGDAEGSMSRRFIVRPTRTRRRT
jgi:hypothetical protein